MLNYVLYVNCNYVTVEITKKKKKKMKCKKLPGTNCGVVKLLFLTIVSYYYY